MKKRLLLVIVFGALVLNCASSGDFDPLPGNEPVIHESYAPSVIRPGTTWRIYLHAEDFDGDMKEIITFVTQTGVAPFPTVINKLKGEDTREVAGYLYMNTSSDSLLLGDRVEVLLIIRDQRENDSRRIKFSLRFDHVPLAELPEKWEGVANRRLGAVTLDDIVPSQKGGPSGASL